MGKQINERIFCMLNIILNSLGKIISFFLGELDGLLYALVIFVILDYITGVCVAIQTKKLSSNIGAKGIAKKSGNFLDDLSRTCGGSVSCRIHGCSSICNNAFLSVK